jgi:hypothetical protein
MLLNQLKTPSYVALSSLEEMYVELATEFNAFVDHVSQLNEAVTAPYDDDIELQIDEISKRLEAAKLGLKIAKRLQDPKEKKKHTLRILSNMKQIKRSMKSVTNLMAQFSRAEDDFSDEVFGQEPKFANNSPVQQQMKPDFRGMSAEQEEESGQTCGICDQKADHLHKTRTAAGDVQGCDHCVYGGSCKG